MLKKTIPIKGMHCRSCEILVEDELLKIPGVKKAQVSEKKGQAILYCKNEIQDKKIERAIIEAGYSIGTNEKKPFFSKNLADYIDVIICGIILIIVYVVTNELGILKLFSLKSNNYASLPVVFLVGLTAGLSTCMALVGGLVLATSARFSEKHPTATPVEKFKPHLFFNLGRVISFFVLGGVIGLVGSFFQLSSTTLGILTILVGGVMLMLGMQLTNLFPRLSNVGFTLPKNFSRILGISEHSKKEYSHTNSFIMGGLTFFLPCGFTQAMQLFAISSGSAITGALTMGVFALGTAPGLLGIGGLTSAVKGSFAKMFFKFAGIVVIFLALFNIKNGYNLTGFNINLNKKTAVSQSQDPNVAIENGVQVVKMTQDSSGYNPNSFTIKKDIPVRWIINSTDVNTCASSIIAAKLNIHKSLQLGDNVIEFTPKEIGEIRFSCTMGMYTGVFNVIDGSSNNSPTPTVQTQANRIPATSCGGGGCGCGNKTQRQQAVDADKTPPIQAEENNSVQVIKATYSVADDVKPTKFTVKVGIPVRFDIEAKEDGAGCMGSIMIPGLDNNPQGFEKGKTTSLTFTPQKPGSYTITCAMGVPRGTIIVE